MSKEEIRNEFSVIKKDNGDMEIIIDKLSYNKRIMIAIRTLLCLKPLVIFRNSEFKYYNKKSKKRKNK